MALALAGCSPASLMEQMPNQLGGLPSGTPAAPRASYSYPAVHDTPPPRATTTLTDEQQLEMEKQLQNVRQRQESEAAGMKDAPAGEDSDGK
ncbi:MAG TPA: hypothetical protein VE224_04135 [Pseudolabrys sp.]|nr:hypothetical protein [Pseudolabrys sp.]